MAFLPADIEDGTGLPTALVYEPLEDALAWLTRRGFTALALKAASQAAAAETDFVRATMDVDNLVRPFLERSEPTRRNQGLLFPRDGAYSSAGYLFEPDELPAVYLEGIRLIAEHMAAGSYMLHSGGPVGIEEERSRNGAIKYRPGSNPNSFQSNHAEEWRRISTVVPSL